MQTEIVFSGFGGQGLLFSGQLVAYTAMSEGKHVTWIPSYGPEMRGGTANCTVVISDDPVGSPVVRNPAIAAAFNLPSFDKYAPTVKPGGLLVVNSALIERNTSRTDIEVLRVPANDIAAALGNARFLNVVMVGAMLARRPVVSLEAVEQMLDAKLTGKKRVLLEKNIEALRAGYALAQKEPA